LFRMALKIIRLRPWAIHLNSELPVLLPLYPLFALFNSVITLHDAVLRKDDRFARRAFMWFHLPLVFLFIRKVIVHGGTLREALPKYLRHKVHVLPHVNYQIWARARQSPPEDGPLVILFFGRLLPYKGLDVLLEAFRRLDPTKFLLLIAGEGDLPSA